MSEAIEEPKQKQKRESESGDSSSVAKKVKLEHGQDPEVESSEREVGFEIEAEAAEDKGLRQSMEDAWVVHLDASLGFKGTLRFFDALVFVYYVFV